MDLTAVATLLGVRPERRAPVSDNGSVDGLKPPPWWSGGDEAAQSSIEAARQMGFVVGMTT